MTRAHDEAVGIAESAFVNQPGPMQRDKIEAAIRAYHAHRRATDGAVLVVVPPAARMEGVFDYDHGRMDGWNEALAAVRASAETPHD